MNEDDKKSFLDDFKKADLSVKVDMWFYAMDQEALWEEIMDEMSKIARMAIIKEGGRSIPDE
jgi:hypothetical protein